MANTKSMVKRKLCDPDPEHIAAKEDFRKIAMEIYKSLIECQIFLTKVLERGMVLAKEVKRRIPGITNSRIYLRFRQIGWKSYNGSYSPPSWELDDDKEVIDQGGATVTEVKTEIQSEPDFI